MTDAGGTTTCNLLTNVGTYETWIVHNTSVDDGETIPIDGTGGAGVPGIQAEDRVMIRSISNWTEETSGAGTALSAEYDETNMHFTVTESGITSDSIAIEFILIRANDKALGTA